MNAIIVPGVNDLNKGDQALIWESHRIIKDTNLFNEIYLLNIGDSEHEKYITSNQTAKKGYDIIENILKHPRRGLLNNDNVIIENKHILFSQYINVFKDFISTFFLLKICNSKLLLNFFYPKYVFNTIQKFKNCDVVFIKGGGFLHTYKELKSEYIIWYFLFYIRLAKRFNKKIIILPNSFGPFNGITVPHQVYKVLNNVDLIFARELISAQYLSRLLNYNIDVEMDLGFFLESSDTFNIDDLFHKYNMNINEKYIAITIRPWRFPGLENPEMLYNNYLISMCEFVNYLISNNYKVLFCNQSLGPNSHEDDRIAINEFLLNFPSTLIGNKIFWINEDLPCDVLKLIYEKCYLIIGTRFHSVIFSITSCIPVIAIAYGGNKAFGIMKKFDLQNNVININNINYDDLRLIFEYTIANYESFKKNLKNNFPEIKTSRQNLIYKIKCVVKDSK